MVIIWIAFVYVGGLIWLFRWGAFMGWCQLDGVKLVKHMWIDARWLKVLGCYCIV